MTSQSGREARKTASHAVAGPRDALYYVYAIGLRTDLEPLFAKTLPEPLAGGNLELVTHNGLAAVMSAVPRGEYGEAALEERMSDAEWITARALEHERVVAHFAKVGVIPLRFGSVYHSRSHVEGMLESRYEELSAVAIRLSGCDEWSLTLYCDRQRLGEYLESQRPHLREAAAEVSSASPGQAYLLGKKLDRLKAEEMVTEKRMLAGHIQSRLAAASVDAKRLLPSKQAESPYGEETARFAFLVQRGRVDGFKSVAAELASQSAEQGVTLELVGPWPPYNFVDLAPAGLGER